jgi:hypothetical protein
MFIAVIIVMAVGIGALRLGKDKQEQDSSRAEGGWPGN